MKKFFLPALLLSGLTLNAQNIGINSTGAIPSGDAMLDISSTNKGLLVPRVNITDLTTIAPITGGATTGLLVYNTNAGTGLGYFYWDGGDWIKFLGEGDVDNGLYFNGAAERVRLGGPLVEATTITQGANAMTFNLNSTGDFNVQDNGTTRFQVLDNGRIEMSGTTDASGAVNTGVLEIANALRLDGNEIITNTNATLFINNDNNGDVRFDATTLAVDASVNRVGIGTTAPTYELDVAGNIGQSDFMYHNDDADTYFRFPAADQIRMYAGNVRMMDIVEGGTDYVVFNENSADVDFRIESNGQANQFFINGGNDRIGIRTNAPANFFHMTNGGVNVGATSMALFANAGASGVAITGNNTSTGNPYNGIEGVTNGVYTGVFGLGITTGAGGDGVNGTTNDWQSIGVVGSRFNSGGADTGFGGLFSNDLGYTGGLFNVSDQRLKKNIQPMTDALGIVTQLNPVTYNYKSDEFTFLSSCDHLEYGFIAQEVEKVLPEVVKIKSLDAELGTEASPNSSTTNESEEFYMMDYTRIIPILTKAVQEQQVIIEDQNSRIETLNIIVLQLQNEISNQEKNK